MGRKQHYHDLNELMDDLDHESLMGDDGTELLDEADLELLHNTMPLSAPPPTKPPPKKRGRKPKPKPKV